MRLRECAIAALLSVGLFIAAEDRLFAQSPLSPQRLADVLEPLAKGHAGEVAISVRILDEAGQVRRATMRAEGTDKRCPVCRRLLCGDLLDQEYNDMFRSLVGMRLGIDRHEAGGKLTGGTRRGPQLLTDEQLRFECKVIIGKTEGTRESLLEELLQK